jgi:hypothetical protein
LGRWRRRLERGEVNPRRRARRRKVPRLGRIGMQHMSEYRQPSLDMRSEGSMRVLHSFGSLVEKRVEVRLEIRFTWKRD